MGGTDFFEPNVVERRSAKSIGAPAAVDVIRPVGAESMPNRPISDLNLTRMTRHREEMNTQVVSAKLEIEKLKLRQNELEREKQNVEELGQQQVSYESGKQQLLDRLSASLVSLEKLEEQAVRMSELYAGARERFVEMRKDVQGINDATWSDQDFRQELGNALVRIDDIRKEYVRTQAVIEAAGGPSEASGRPASMSGGELNDTLEKSGFGVWLQRGLAFCLPLIVTLLLIALVVALSGRHLP
ncbi:MAG: hypothetical protein WCL16_09250 [bacterium]